MGPGPPIEFHREATQADLVVKDDEGWGLLLTPPRLGVEVIDKRLVGDVIPGGDASLDDPAKVTSYLTGRLKEVGYVIDLSGAPQPREGAIHSWCFIPQGT